MASIIPLTPTYRKTSLPSAEIFNPLVESKLRGLSTSSRRAAGASQGDAYDPNDDTGEMLATDAMTYTQLHRSLDTAYENSIYGLERKAREQDEMSPTDWLLANGQRELRDIYGQHQKSKDILFSYRNDLEEKADRYHSLLNDPDIDQSALYADANGNLVQDPETGEFLRTGEYIDRVFNSGFDPSTGEGVNPPVMSNPDIEGLFDEADNTFANIKDDDVTTSVTEVISSPSYLTSGKGGVSKNSVQTVITERGFNWDPNKYKWGTKATNQRSVVAAQNEFIQEVHSVPRLRRAYNYLKNIATNEELVENPITEEQFDKEFMALRSAKHIKLFSEKIIKKTYNQEEIDLTDAGPYQLIGMDMKQPDRTSMQVFVPNAEGVPGQPKTMYSLQTHDLKRWITPMYSISDVNDRIQKNITPPEIGSGQFEENYLYTRDMIPINAKDLADYGVRYGSITNVVQEVPVPAALYKDEVGEGETEYEYIYLGEDKEKAIAYLKTRNDIKNQAKNRFQDYITSGAYDIDDGELDVDVDWDELRKRVENEVAEETWERYHNLPKRKAVQTVLLVPTDNLDEVNDRMRFLYNNEVKRGNWKKFMSDNGGMTSHEITVDGEDYYKLYVYQPMDDLSKLDDSYFAEENAEIQATLLKLDIQQQEQEYDFLDKYATEEVDVPSDTTGTGN